jgi:hypothetical protein
VGGGGVIPSSEITALSDEHIIVKFGGDKGGSKMSSKIGVTLYNQRSVNEAEAFGFIVTCEALHSSTNFQESFYVIGMTRLPSCSRLIWTTRM